MTISDSRIRPRVALDRLAHCTGQDRGTPSWWSCLARNLDLLAEELEIADTVGLVGQVVTDAPHLAPAAVRLTALESRVRTDVAELRLAVAALAGAPLADAVLADRLSALLDGVRDLYRNGDTLLLDAYELDLGGE
jgi:hypothetical protein